MSSRPSTDEWFLSMLDIIKQRSTCPRRQVAAILVDRHSKLLSTGYNGVPSGMQHCIDVPCRGAGDQAGDNSKCIAIHAEMNAIMQAGDRVKQAFKLYCSATPCFACAKLIANTSVQIIHAKVLYPDGEALNLLRSQGIGIFIDGKMI